MPLLRIVPRLVLVLAACIPATAWSLGPGDTAFGFSLPDIEDGRTVSLEDFEGKVVYLDFWASWCGPCRKSLPLYEDLNTRISEENFAIIAVNLDENPDSARKFLQAHPVSYTVLLDPSGAVAEQWQVPAMPSSYLIGSDRRVVRAWAGFKPSHLEEIEREIHAAVSP